MLQRAASNAYSWWWASHVRTKQSKWLEQNLQDMEEKVSNTLRIIDDGGDSFAQRAEMYYRKRPELINFVEESFRAYRALAERYDHLSRELQSANRTIATVYPERVHEFAMDADDEENPSLTSTSSSSSTDQSKRSIPKVPKIPNKDFRSPSMSISRKGSQLKKLASSSSSVKPAPSSGLTRTEALEEIDNVQKGILGLQTEKEFVKSMYEHGYQKFWEIENQITEMQKRVSSLQDEFGIQTVIEDDEARALMAATALKSCQDTLVKLQEKQDRSAEEARVEQQKIKDAHEKFSRIREKFLGKQTEGRKVESKEENLDEEIVGTEESNVEMLREKIKEKLDVSSKSSLTVTELAEKIDELVNKVVSLETEVSSQTALVKRLGLETDQLQANVRSLENDNESLKEGSKNMSKELRELEEELRRVKILNQSFRVQNDNLQTHFTEASCNLDHLSEKLQSVKQDEEVEDSKPRKSIGDEEEEKKDSSTVLDNSVENRTNPSNDPGFERVEVEEQKQEEVGEEKKELSDETKEILEVEKEGEEAGGQRNLRRLFLKGLEDREKILLEEYTSVLQDYKEVKKKLSEMENKNRDSIFELAVQIRELKSDIASKDEELKSLKNKFEYPPQTNPDESPFTCSTEYKYPTSQEPSAESLSEIPPLHSDRDSISDELENQNVETLEKLMASADNLKGSNENDEDREKMVDQKQAAKPYFVSPIIEKFRSDIDGLLEENLEFWLRFSTSVHQIQKFETSIEDLHLDLSKLKENHNKKREGITGSQQHSILSDARPIYRHLREIQTEMSLWLEHNAVLKDELQGRFSSLCNIQDEISRVSGAGSEAKNAGLSEYQAAKFQGEVLNMKQENNKVADELKVGLNRVKGFKVEVEKSLVKLNEELGISATKNDHSPNKHHPPRPRIPLRSFLFGVKLKRQKPSIFSCVSPALQKQYSDLAAAGPLPA